MISAGLSDPLRTFLLNEPIEITKVVVHSVKVLRVSNSYFEFVDGSSEIHKKIIELRYAKDQDSNSNNSDSDRENAAKRRTKFLDDMQEKDEISKWMRKEYSNSSSNSSDLILDVNVELTVKPLKLPASLLPDAFVLAKFKALKHVTFFTRLSRDNEFEWKFGMEPTYPSFVLARRVANYLHKY